MLWGGWNLLVWLFFPEFQLRRQSSADLHIGLVTIIHSRIQAIGSADEFSCLFAIAKIVCLPCPCGQIFGTQQIFIAYKFIQPVPPGSFYRGRQCKFIKIFMPFADTQLPCCRIFFQPFGIAYVAVTVRDLPRGRYRWNMYQQIVNTVFLAKISKIFGFLLKKVITNSPVKALTSGNSYFACTNIEALV